MPSPTLVSQLCSSPLQLWPPTSLAAARCKRTLLRPCASSRDRRREGLRDGKFWLRALDGRFHPQRRIVFRTKAFYLPECHHSASPSTCTSTALPSLRTSVSRKFLWPMSSR